MPKPAWDSTVQDLTKHSISQEQAEKRRQRLTSPNALAAKADLERRRAMLARGSFESTLAALAGQTTDEISALRELDEVEVELHRLADDAQGMQPPRRPTRIDVPMVANTGRIDECATPPTPAMLETLEAPWAPGASPLDAMLQEAQPKAADQPPVVDLDEEIALFRHRTGQRLAAAGFDAADADAVGAPPAAPEPAQSAEPPLPRTTAQPAVRSAPKKPDWRPAMGRRSLVLENEPRKPTAPPAVSAPSRAPSAPTPRGGAGAKAPDALGLARMQHSVGELTALVGAYETARETGEGTAAVLASATAIGHKVTGTRLSEGTSGSFSNCNAQIMELTSRMVAHLARSDMELQQQVARRAESDLELKECRAKLEQQADVTEVETAALRREVRLLKESHGAQLATLTTQLATLQTARNNNLLTSMAASLQQSVPLPASPQAPVMTSAAAAKAASEQPERTRPKPSLLFVAPKPAAEATITPAADEEDEEPSAPPAVKMGPPLSLTVERAPPTERKPDAALVTPLVPLPLPRTAAYDEPPVEDEMVDVTMEEESRGRIPTAWAERAEATKTPTELGSAAPTPREPKLLAPGAMPASALPAVVRCSIGPPQRVVAGSESSPPPRSRAAVVTNVIRGSAADAAKAVTAANAVVTPSSVGGGDDPSWLNLGPSDIDDKSSDERSQEVLQAYYDELASRGRSGGAAPKKEGVPSLTLSAVAPRRTQMGRAVRSSIEPTNLFGGDSTVVDAC